MQKLPGASPFVVPKQSFQDFEDLRETIKHWNLDFRQLEAGRFRGEILQVNSEDVCYVNARFRQKLHQQGAAPEEYFTVAIPGTSCQRLRWHGYDVSASDIMIFPSDGELNSASDENFHVYTVSLSEEKFQEAFAIQDASAGRVQFSGPRVIRCRADSVRQLLRLLHKISVTHPPTSTEENADLRMELLSQTLPMLLTRVITEATNGEAPRLSAKRRALVSKAIALIQQSSHFPITVEDICERTGVSMRTLQYAFRQCLNVTPKCYIQAYRLQRVKAELACHRHSPLLVSDVANKWGFWHMGDFARIYQRFFLEKPSETRRFFSS
ncbi:helix-turn-helix domain-containing protein [Blastopirellula retiformator]|nr:helix-turn-helix domain-containing protein [Blastopirellula retiformator]